MKTHTKEKYTGKDTLMQRLTQNVIQKFKYTKKMLKKMYNKETNMFTFIKGRKRSTYATMEINIKYS